MEDDGARTTDLDIVFRAAHRWRLLYPGADALVAAMRIQRTHAAMTASINRLLKPLDLNSTLYEILAMMTCSGQSVLIGQISDWLMVHPTSATNHVARLEATGYVRRIPNPADRRSTLVELTSRGEEVMDEATEIVVSHRFGLSGLSPVDHVQLDRILSRLADDA